MVHMGYKPKPERTRLDLPTNRKSLRLRLASHPALQPPKPLALSESESQSGLGLGLSFVRNGTRR